MKGAKVSPRATATAQTAAADVKTGEIVEQGAIEALRLSFPGLEVSNDSTATQQRIIDRMMQANSIDDLFATREGASIDQMVGKVLEFVGVTWSTYQTDEGTEIPLAQLQCVDVAKKEAISLIATAPGVTAFVYRAEQLGAMPFKAKVAEVKTRRGFNAIVLERP